RAPWTRRRPPHRRRPHQPAEPPLIGPAPGETAAPRSLAPESAAPGPEAGGEEPAELPCGPWVGRDPAPAAPEESADCPLATVVATPPPDVSDPGTPLVTTLPAGPAGLPAPVCGPPLPPPSVLAGAAGGGPEKRAASGSITGERW